MWPVSNSSTDGMWPQNGGLDNAEFKPVYIDLFGLEWRNVWVYNGACCAQLHRRVELPEFMILTKKEYNDLVAERAKHGLSTKQCFTPMQVGRGRGESQMGFAK